MSDIVIDADIMRAAGTSEHPHSSNARKLLDAISTGKHRMVQCTPLKAEHDRHQSRYSSRWRASMVSRKQWVHWNYEQDAALRESLVAALPAEAVGKKRAALKDAHLLESAAATGQRIVSKDSTAKHLFQLACPNLDAHRNILWGDLTIMPATIIEWVKNGCVDQNDLKLCPVSVKKTSKKVSRKSR